MDDKEKVFQDDPIIERARQDRLNWRCPTCHETSIPCSCLSGPTKTVVVPNKQYEWMPISVAQAAVIDWRQVFAQGYIEVYVLTVQRGIAGTPWADMSLRLRLEDAQAIAKRYQGPADEWGRTSPDRWRLWCSNDLVYTIRRFRVPIVAPEAGG